jgi:hypothetical protein
VVFGICGSRKCDKRRQGCNYGQFSHEWSSLIKAAIESCLPIA